MDKIISMLRELHPDIDFETAEALVDDGILDSMDIVSLVTAIYDEFDVRIPADRILPENFNSAAALGKLVNELIDE